MATPRTWASRLTLAGHLAAIHKEAWIPAAVVIGTAWASGLHPIATLVAANFATWLAYTWWHAGAYTRNAEDTLIQRFHHQWRLATETDPDNTPTLVAVHIERAPRPEARALRRNQGRHALGALSMKLVVRPKPDQAAAKDWVPKFQASKKAEYGFQTATDPRPAPLDNNALEFTFGQERLPTEVRAVVR